MKGKVFRAAGLLLLFQYLIVFIQGDSSSCIYQQNCEKCLTADFKCAWCIDKGYGNIKPRCMTHDDLIQANCSASDIIVNSPEKSVLLDDELQDFEENVDKITQIRPQKVKLKLVKSHTEQIKLTYRPAKNNPLDLYVLMDLTWSMRDDKETLVGLGEKLAHTLGNLTSNYRLGFGTFADKPAMPMTQPGRNENPCSAEYAVCEPTYGFRHLLSMTKESEKFVQKVSESHVTGNLDNLEGGLDALMQVIVCEEEIGWNNDARKMVILATDGLIHFAGDGLLAGIVRRNDKTCHLSRSRVEDYYEYDGSLIYDYPSLEEIYRELVRRKIMVVFAVTADVKETYHQINALMKEITGVEILSLDSSNILDLVNKGYQKFAQRVEFQDDSPPYVSVTYETDCGATLNGTRIRNFCDKIQMGETVDFYINITLKDFPPNGENNFTINIEDVTLSDSLEIEVEIQEPCPCAVFESEDEELKFGEIYCNSNGRFHCGMCFCDEGWLGDKCSCNSHNLTSIRVLENQCRRPLEDSTLGQICSDHGECECGKCFCNRGYEGSYCECKECSSCGDPDHFDCNCGECICKPGWTGFRCECTDSEDSCISPDTGVVCNNRGECECGNCLCFASYFGKFCETNSDEVNQLCSYYEPCVKCRIEEQIGEFKGDCTEFCTAKDSTLIHHVYVKELSNDKPQCIIRIKTKEDDNCEHQFSYESDFNTGSSLEIIVNSCEKVNYATAGIIFFVATLLLGLLVIVIFKTVFFFQDRREYAAFVKQQEGTSFNMESPLYKSPITSYQVPHIED